ncbi:MAG: 30S ribosomal protein S6e [Candidatus Aenigmarchaeota archaeon]|nr:30S ribosomal protein S6e [Candidatus Aenigmarchaeota archaeon]
MANFKIVISDPKEKKAYQKEVDQNASGLIGKKIGEQVDGGLLGLSGYKLEVTGGSDKQGFPMRKDVDGAARKKIILTLPPGFHPSRKGQRKRKSIRGNTISAEASQINTKIVEYGQKPISQLVGGIEKKSKDEKKKEEMEKMKEQLQAGEKTEAKMTESDKILAENTASPDPNSSVPSAQLQNKVLESGGARGSASASEKSGEEKKEGSETKPKEDRPKEDKSKEVAKEKSAKGEMKSNEAKPEKAEVKKPKKDTVKENPAGK